MTRSVLIATDFSIQARKMTLTAIDWLNDENTVFYLIHVVEPKLLQVDFLIKIDDIVLKYPQQRLTDEVELLNNMNWRQKPVIIKKFATGNVAKSISDVARDLNIDLVVAGFDGAQTENGHTIGHVSKELMQQQLFKVLFIPKLIDIKSSVLAIQDDVSELLGQEELIVKDNYPLNTLVRNKDLHTTIYGSTTYLNVVSKWAGRIPQPSAALKAVSYNRQNTTAIANAIKGYRGQLLVTVDKSNEWLRQLSLMLKSDQAIPTFAILKLV